METMIHLDTHVVAWLHDGDVKRLRPVWKTLDRSQLVVSPMALLELQFLFEIGRATRPAEQVFVDVADKVGLRLSDAPFADVVRQSLTQSWTRDPFDRLIVANAVVDGHALLTRDDSIRAHFSRALWR
jgi:PIN domain nuclease of toxin-antitoxin system